MQVPAFVQLVTAERLPPEQSSTDAHITPLKPHWVLLFCVILLAALKAANQGASSTTAASTTSASATVTQLCEGMQSAADQALPPADVSTRRTFTSYVHHSAVTVGCPTV